MGKPSTHVPNLGIAGDFSAKASFSAKIGLPFDEFFCPACLEQRLAIACLNVAIGRQTIGQPAVQLGCFERIVSKRGIPGAPRNRPRIIQQRILKSLDKLPVSKDLVRLAEKRQMPRVEPASLDDFKQQSRGRASFPRQSENQRQSLPTDEVIRILLQDLPESRFGIRETI